MKVLLRKANTGLYFSRQTSWVPDSTQAVSFPTLEVAGSAALECGEGDVKVVLKYEDPDCELALNPEYCR